MYKMFIVRNNIKTLKYFISNNDRFTKPMFAVIYNYIIKPSKALVNKNKNPDLNSIILLIGFKK